MRTSTAIISSALLIASSNVVAFSFPEANAFDSSLLRARGFMPDVMPMSNNNLEKRRDAAGPWECTDDEEWVEYEGDDEEDDNTPAPAPAAPAPAPAAPSSKNEEKVFTPEAGKVNAVQPTSSSKADTPIKQEQQQQQTQPASSSKNTDPTPAPMPVPQKAVTSTPDNIAEGTYTAEEGCIRYRQVKSGDVCLGLVAENSDIGLTLDQLYCLNPAIDDLCYNLWIGTSYCVGYGGEEPLNTGVSSAKA